MKYTKYFAFITKENGVPNLSEYQFRKMMNIVHLEGEVNGMKYLKEKLINTKGFNKYDIFIFKKETHITDLTGNLEPSELVKEMFEYR